ncbi:MAG: ABC transporter permease subunit [Rhodospirillales bacterium]|nr:ABC transporter permease subunit [Rhodospirillales bacterium]
MTNQATIQPAFAMSRIWRDEKSRGVAIQIIVVLAFFISVAWLVGNVTANFAALDKTFGFKFLWQLPANYDINQTLIDYNNQDNHLCAALVGLINTFLVAVVGIVLATILGFIVGALRLSDNWLVARLAYVYIEAMRNVPVLLHILLWHGIIINTLPHPRRAIGVGDAMFLSNRGLYLPRPVLEDGFGLVLIAFAAAVIVAAGYHRRARRIQRETGRQIHSLWIGFAVIVAVTALAYLAAGAPVAFEMPALRGFNFQGGITLLPEFVALTLALSIYTSAFIAENVRGGILAIHKGQTEAAQSIGLRPNRVLTLVVLPQALRVIIPPLTSQYLNLTKNSSLAIAIGYMDLVATLGGITLNQTGREMEAMMLVMLVYLAISLLISAFMKWYNNRVRLVER